MPHTRPTRLALALALATCSSFATADSVSSNLQINGFATAGGTSVTDDFGGRYLGDNFVPGSGIDNDGSFNFDNVLGVQLSYQVDDRVGLVGQLISVGKEDYDTRAEWAYLSYRVNDSLRVRTGRFALPFYMYSENIRVGQAYPWARLPAAVYSGVPFYSADGVDALYRLPLGAWNLNAQAYQSRSTFDTPSYTAEGKNSHGVNVTLSNDSFSVRAAYNESKVSISFAPTVPALPVNGEKISFASLGMIYDDGAWFAAAEATQLHMNGYVADSDAAFVSVGHYFGKWLPYVLLSKVNAVSGDECRTALAPGFAPFGPLAPGYVDATCRGQEKEQTTYALGFRYDLNKRTSLKLEVEHVTDFHNTPGLFAGLTPVPGPASLMNVPGTLTDSDSTEIITFNINTAF